MVGHVFLFNAGIVKLKELLNTGELGKLHYVAAVRTNLGPIRSDVNAAYDLAAHDIAIFNWLLDSEPETVSATGGAFLQLDIEDVVFITLRYPGNVLASIHASWLNPKKIRQITIVGSQKMLTWDDLELNAPVAIYDKGANAINEPGDYGEFLRMSMWDGEVRLPKITSEEPLKVQDRHFLDAIQQGTDVNRSDGRFGLGVVSVLQSIAQSLSQGGAPVQTNSDRLLGRSEDG
jgi:predicted dehydrogenase